MNLSKLGMGLFIFATLFLFGGILVFALAGAGGGLSFGTVAIGLLIVGGMLYLALRRGLQMRKLALDGQATQATIVKKFRTGSASGTRSASHPYLRYEYQDPTGTTYSYKCLVSEEQWEKHEVGDPFGIVYVRSDPKISGPKYLVDPIREMMENKAAKKSSG
jgi:hypothetical protein